MQAAVGTSRRRGVQARVYMSSNAGVFTCHEQRRKDKAHSHVGVT